MQKGNPPALLVGKLSWPSHYENSMEVSQKTKNRITIRLSNPTPGHISRQNYNSKRYMHFYVHISTIHNSQDTETTCPQTDEWINKIWHICTMEYYSAIKKNEIMPFEATWMQLEIIILSEVKSEGERQIPYDITYVWHKSKSMTQMNLSIKQKQIHGHREDLRLPSERELGERWSGRLGLADVSYYI